ncbi:MAG: TatD family hydrolase [Candidatus Omnitrophica bacterium]|nr:TatD family hydrolase [Candidatus Omnitrophota bacterium]
MLIDTHCHLDFPEYDSDRDAVIQRAKDNNLEYVINVGSDVQNSRRAVLLSRKYDMIFAAVGCHPHDADGFNEQAYNDLEELSRDNKVVAIGEIGLDYYRNLSSVDNQKNVFVRLIRLAAIRKLPLVIHSRQAPEDTLAILRQEQVKEAIIHCFSGDADFMRQCLDLGYYLSFTCNITYKKAENLRQLLKIAPLDRICLETDAPYLSPEGYRGKRNEPWFVKMAAEEIARVRGISFEEVCRATTENAKKFFNLKSQEQVLKHIL